MTEMRFLFALFLTLVYGGYLVWVVLNWRAARGRWERRTYGQIVMNLTGLAHVVMDGFYRDSDWSSFSAIALTVFALLSAFVADRVWRPMVATLLPAYLLGILLRPVVLETNGGFYEGAIIGIVFLAVVSILWIVYLHLASRPTGQAPKDLR